MLRFLGRRAVQGGLVLLVISVVVFFMYFIAPHNVARLLAGRQATAQTVADVARRLGLNRPVADQYWSFLWGLLHGNLGYSFYSSEPVSSLIASVCSGNHLGSGRRRRHLARDRHRYGRPGRPPPSVRGRPLCHGRGAGLLLDAALPARSDTGLLPVFPAPFGRGRPVPRQRVCRDTGQPGQLGTAPGPPMGDAGARNRHITSG